MKFYANPYNRNVCGFYFETFDEFEEGVEELKKECGFPIEEFTIEIIDGSRDEIELAQCIDIKQSNLESVLDVIENLNENDWPRLFFLLDYNITPSLEDAKDKLKDVCISRCNLQSAAEELFNDCYVVPPEIRHYIDYEKFAFDLEQDGRMVEFEFAGNTYTCTNVNEL